MNKKQTQIKNIKLLTCMRLDVDPKVLAPRERLRTHPAQVRLLASMYSHVLLELRGADAAPAARRANVRLLATVRPRMHRQS